MNFYTKLFFVLVAVYLINASQSFASTSYDPWVYFNCKATKGSVSVNFDFKKNKNDGSIKFIHGTTGIVDTYNSAEIGVEPDKNQRIRANSQSMDYFDFSWSKNLPSQDWQDKIRVNFDLTINKRRITTVVSTLQTVTFGPKKETLDAGRYRGECSITENTSSEVLESSASFGQMNYNCKVEETLSGIQYPKSFNIEVRNNRIKSFKFVGDTKAVKISKIQKTSISDKGTRILWNTRNANFNINHNLEIEASGLFRIGSIHQGHVHEHIAKGKCFCGRSDGCAIKAKVKQPKNSSNKQAFNSFDANGRISIQKALTDLKFYNSSIDGSYGPGTDKAIEKYLKNNGISGSTKKSVLTALKKLIAEQVQSDELAIVKSEQSSKDTLLAAQLIIKDVEEFLKSGSGSFDLEFAKKYSAIRKVSKGQWNSNLENKFADFKSYVFANEVFQKYSEDQKNKREAEFKAILKNNRQQLTDLTESLRIWLQANLIHEKADDVYDQVAASEKTLEGNDLQEIQQTIMKADKLANSLNLKQKTLSVDATQKAKMEINEAAFNSFDANGRISIQKALTDLKFYNSSIDGSYGPGTDKAIEKYLKNNGISGSTKKSVLTALKKLIAEQVQSDELAIVKSEQSSKDTLLAAQLIIKDVEEFLKSGSGSFDLEFAKKYSAIRKVSKGQWNSNLENKFADFKSYVFANEVFQKYSEDQKNKREAEFKAILKNNRQQLTDLTESLRIWLQANLIHEKADDVYDQVAASEKTLEGNDLQEIQQTIMKADKLANSLNLKQKTLSVDATQKAKMEINEAAFNSFDANGRISIQKALSDFGLFKLEIDGVFGPGINIAITEYLKTKGITEITSSDAVIEQLKILVSATLDSNALAVVRSEMSAEEEYLAAVVVMQDIETFLSEKIGSFGLDFIRKYGPARGVSKGFWSDEKRASFLALKEYVFANEDFRNYANNQKLEREQALLNEISSAKDKLTEHLGLLRLWLEANLIDERAEEIFETVSNIEKALEGKALNNLLKILEVTTRTVKDLNLINNVTKSVKTDSKYELDAIYMFVNLSGFANHVFKNLDGVLELEGGNANICQIGDIDDWDQFAAFQKLNKLVDIEKSTLKFNCGQSEDFYILAGTSLASGTLPNIVANTDLSDLYLLSKDEIVDLKRRFQYKSEANYEDVLAGVKNGYGLFYIAGHPPIICSSEDDNIDAHLQLINEKQDIIRYFAPKSEKIDFNLSLSTINKRLQKKTCGMIYGSSRDLKILADASINTNKYEVEFLPIWFSDQKVNEAIQFQKNRQALNNSKELDAEQQRILKEEKLKKLRESAENRQRELRALNDVKFTSIIDRLQVGVREIVNEIFEDQADNNVVNSNYEVNEELLELMSPIQFDLLNKKLEGWEPVSTAINKVDFGTIIFNNRKPEAIIVELEINMKNRKIGKFDPYCKRIHIAYDLDFDMWRREIFSDCATEARTNRWKLKNDFESGWIVKVE